MCCPPFGCATDFSPFAIACQQAAVDAARSNANSRTLDDLGKIGVPTLIVQGQHDRVHTPERRGDARAHPPWAA